MTRLLLAMILLSGAALPVQSAPDLADLTWYLPTPTCHAAAWHGQVPYGWPLRPDWERYGVAAPLAIPFGTRLRLTRLDTGVTADAIVVDRTADGQGYDAWPALATALGFGPHYGEQDAGRVRVRVEILP